MPNEVDDKSQSGNGADGTGSSPEKTATTETPQNTVAEPQQSAEKIPFDQDPRVQEYISRQIEKRWNRFLAESETKAQEQDISIQLEREMIDEGMDARTAKKIINVFARLADDKLKKNLYPLQEDLNKQVIMNRFVQFASSHKDFESYRSTMWDIYSNLSQDEQRFIESSPNGIDFLYSKAKLLKQPASENQSQTFSTQGRGTGKFNPGENLAEKASEALSKGDKVAYKELMATLNARR